MILIHARFQVDPLKEPVFLAETASLIQASKEESGNLSYQLFKDTEQEHQFMMVEVWKDAAAVEAHNSSEHFTAFAAKAGQFLTAPLDIQVYDAQPLKS